MIRTLLADGLQSLRNRIVPADFKPQTYASATDLEGATDLTKIVSPGIAHRHPGVAKAVVHFTITGGVLFAYNVSTATGVLRNGTGDYTLYFTTNFSASDVYVPLGAINGGADGFLTFQSNLVGGIDMRVMDASTGSPTETNVDSVYVVVFGDQ